MKREPDDLDRLARYNGSRCRGCPYEDGCPSADCDRQDREPYHERPEPIDHPGEDR